VDTPKATALEGNFPYFVETFGNGIARVAVNRDGSAVRPNA
jgi:hypothetical protein